MHFLRFSKTWLHLFDTVPSQAIKSSIINLFSATKGTPLKSRKEKELRSSSSFIPSLSLKTCPKTLFDRRRAKGACELERLKALALRRY
ncbi:MAG: hypothetical protein J7J67_02320 [Thermoproteales archaeon]|nr:hypothetical protein [Thermoproteales archaeon]